MAVDALELRPRGAVGIFDAAVRLCSRTSGVWSLTLLGAAFVTGALLYLVDALTQRQSVLLPSLLLTAAWYLRGVGQGAACHYLEAQLLSQTPPSTRASLKAALGRMPSLFITVTMNALFNVFATVVTFGLVLFFFSSNLVSYAVTMHGRGHPLAVYGTCGKLLGPARANATWVRMLFFAQVLVMLNLHIGVNVLVYLGTQLLALDLSFLDRFASLDNPIWCVAVFVVGFSLLEPVRAAVAALLLVDGRVRQEGLDLIAAAEQLPLRRKPKERAVVPTVAAALAVLFLVAAPNRALAQEPESGNQSQAGGILGEAVGESYQNERGETLADRYYKVGEHCGMSGPEFQKRLEAVEALTPRNGSSLSRLLGDVESLAYDDESCDEAYDLLEQRMPLIEAAAARQASLQENASAKAKEILSRPEFAVIPEKDKQETADPEPAAPPDLSWWDRFWKWLEDLLKIEDEPKARRNDGPELDLGGGAAGGLAANLVVVVLVALVVGLLLYLLVKARPRKDLPDHEGVEVAHLEEKDAGQKESALSRPPEGWAHLADELAAQGKFREAIRSLYLALLSRLHRDGAIDYDPSLSNWDYFRRFRGKREWLQPFRELTFRFDFAYYGHLGVDAQNYQSFRTLTQPLLEPGATADSGALPRIEAAS